MICFTGDMHGDRARFSHGPASRLSKRDTLVVCGDFGFVWSGSGEEKRILNQIAKRKYQVLFVEGCHDNLDLLEQYPVEEWNGGLVHRVGENLRHLIRGQIYTIEGQRLLAMGGGSSDDFALREIGVNWWPQELPRAEELDGFRATLTQFQNRVDVIISHQAPTAIEACVTQKTRDVTMLTAYMDELQRRCTFRGWFFGCCHQNRIIPPKYCALYDKAAVLQEDGAIRFLK